MPTDSASPATYRIKFFANASFVRELQADATSDAPILAIESERPVENPTALGFNIETIVAVVAMIKAAIEVGELAAKIYKWWKASKSEVVILQTPFSTLELRKASGVTEEDVRKFLQAATKMSK